MCVEELGVRGVPHRVEVRLRGGFERGAVCVGDYAIPLGRGGRGAARVLLLPPQVEVRLQLVAPAPVEFAFSLTIDGATVEERGTTRQEKERIGFTYPLACFAPRRATAPRKPLPAPRRRRRRPPLRPTRPLVNRRAGPGRPELSC
ncbi:MAG TPA: hypothetical protein VFX98_00625 [Longimicrobiaceae bacterium]|nr:hypothetical protein [Longimicrobiaceae bacterium]